MPASPTYWDGPALNLIRIIDPLGEAIAWFSPDHGACCAGYAVREASGFTRSGTSWRDIVAGSPSNPTVTASEHDAATDASWRFVERDPASCTMDWTLNTVEHVEHRRLTATLTDARLSLVLLVHNAGSEPIPAGARMRIALTSPPTIVNRSAVDASPPSPDDDPRHLHADSRIVLTIDADPGPGTVRTDVVHETTYCRISDHPSGEALPTIQPGMFRRLSVVIGA
jgi:hypothetical protein